MRSIKGISGSAGADMSAASEVALLEVWQHGGGAADSHGSQTVSCFLQRYHNIHNIKIKQKWYKNEKNYSRQCQNRTCEAWHDGIDS